MANQPQVDQDLNTLEQTLTHAYTWYKNDGTEAENVKYHEVHAEIGEALNSLRRLRNVIKQRDTVRFSSRRT